MKEIQTKPRKASVTTFLNAVENKEKKNDSFAIVQMMREATGEEPTMWGPAIVGFGKVAYKYASGHEGETCLIGFSPRKQNLTLYIPGGFEKRGALMKKLGKHKTSKGCLYVNRLTDVDVPTLRKLIEVTVKEARAKNG